MLKVSIKNMLQQLRKQLVNEGLGEPSSQDEIREEASQFSVGPQYVLGESMELREELEELRIEPNSTKDDAGYLERCLAF